MTEINTMGLFFVVFKGKHIALVWREGFDDWDIVRGVFRESPTAEQVQMMLRTDLFYDVVVKNVEKIDFEYREGLEIFLDCPLFGCTVTDITRAKDFRKVRFWSGIGITSGLRLSDATEAVISIESVRDRLF